MNIIVKVQKEIGKLKQQSAVLEAYLEVKRQDRDWHGVWDAAMDLKSIDDRLAILEGIKAEWLTELAEKQKGELKRNVGESDK